MNLTTSREMRIWKIEWLNMARRPSEKRRDSDNDHVVSGFTLRQRSVNGLATLTRK